MFHDHSARSVIKQTLARMAEVQPADPALVARLWFHLRPHANQRLAAGSDHLHGLIALLETHPFYIAALRDHLVTLQRYFAGSTRDPQGE